MMNEEKEDRLDALLRDLAQDYNAPPATPKAELWERIAAARAEPVEALAPRYRIRKSVTWGLALAALLLIGIAIGRVTAPGVPGVTPTAAPREVATTSTPTEPVAVPRETRDSATPRARGAAPTADPAAPEERGTVAMQVVMTQHLGRVESFLTDFGTRQAAAEFAGQAEDLLGTTRLLLDSKRLTDVGARKLLEDLELILVQIAALRAGAQEDLDFIADGLAQRQVRTRLRSAAGPAIRM